MWMYVFSDSWCIFKSGISGSYNHCIFYLEESFWGYFRMEHTIFTFPPIMYDSSNFSAFCQHSLCLDLVKIVYVQVTQSDDLIHIYIVGIIAVKLIDMYLFIYFGWPIFKIHSPQISIIQCSIVSYTCYGIH